jgi:uncharacterized protein YprB with RNaseH-like and TPR domain
MNYKNTTTSNNIIQISIMERLMGKKVLFFDIETTGLTKAHKKTIDYHFDYHFDNRDN